MNAKLAHKTSVASCMDEIKLIQAQIRKAAEIGKTAITVNELKSGSESFLKDEGYSIEHIIFAAGTIIKISW